MIFDYFVLLLWSLYVYGLGIYTKYQNYNIFDIHILLTVMSLYGFFSSMITLFMNYEHPKQTLMKIINLDRYSKIKLFCASFPIYRITIIAFIDLDPTIVTILNSVIIIITFIMSVLFNKKKEMFTKLNITLVLINIFCCMMPFIFNDDFSIKINSNKIGKIGISTTIISIIIVSIINVISENLKFMENINVIQNYSVFTLSTFLLSEVVIYILLIPVMYLLQNYIIDQVMYNKYNKQFIFELISTGCIFALFYGPFYILSTRSYIVLDAIDIGILRNISLVITTIIGCVLKISNFYYLYIPAIIIIIATSIGLLYNIKKINNDKIIPNDNKQTSKNEDNVF